MVFETATTEAIRAWMEANHIDRLNNPGLQDRFIDALSELANRGELLFLPKQNRFAPADEPFDAGQRCDDTYESDSLAESEQAVLS